MTNYARSLSWGVSLSLLGVCGGHILKQHVIDPLRGGSPSQKINPPEGMYHGGFVNHAVMVEHLRCFENMSDQKLDIALRFMNFKELKGKQPFPIREAQIMKERGGALFIKLEPWLGTGSNVSLEAILAGKFDKDLKTFAQSSRLYSFFFTFGHEMNGHWYPWGGNSELYVRAYRYVHDKLTQYGARNITWVWNPIVPGEGIDDFAAYYPGDKYVDWVAINVFHRPGESVDEVIHRLDLAIKAQHAYGKPLMLGEFASSAPAEEKAGFIEKIMAKLKEWKVKATCYFNVSKREENQIFRTWALSEMQARAAYQAGLKLAPPLNENIITGEGQFKDKSKEPKESIDCSRYEELYFPGPEAKRVKELKEIVEDREYSLRHRTEPHKENMLRLQLAKAYRELAFYFKDKNLLDRAIQVLEEALRTPDEHLRYHPRIDYIREYFLLLLELADIQLERGNPKAAQKYIDRINKELRNGKILMAQDVRPESVSGYENRNKLMEAIAFESRGKLKKAKSLYGEVIEWSSQESTRNILWLFFKSSDVTKNPRYDIRYLGEVAKSRLGYIALDENQPAEALRFFREIITWEKVGEEEGPMDLAFAALVGSMRAYLLADPQTAKERFNRELPWKQINQYRDFKKALDIEELDLSRGDLDKWQLMIDKLSNVRLPNEKVEDALGLLRSI